MNRLAIKTSIFAVATTLAWWLSSAVFAEALEKATKHESTADAKIDFDRSIRPILSNACFTCHGPDSARRAADLRLDQEESAKASSIIAGDPANSEILRRILSDDPDEVMPPPDQTQRPSAAEVKLLRQWINEGATWSQHWAYTPPKNEPLPQVKRTDWPQNGIDHFVLATLEANGLSASPPATRETLLRRVTFDLTGLPPTLEEIDALLADQSPEAFERVVDRLLASPRYGEHMAMPWLAAARYADTNGYQSDGTRTMWPWRDWVVKAMNDNMPFDEFTVDQIAGDLLENPTPDQMIATGFHRNHGLNGEGGRDPEESRVEYVIDRASTTGTVWLGLTVGCSRCHDHKYDDISQKEFYQLTAYFNSIDERGGVDAGGNAKPVYALPTDQQLEEVAKLKQQIDTVQQEIATLPAPTAEQQQVWEQETGDWLALADQNRLWQASENLNLACEHQVTWQQLPDKSLLVSKLKDSTDDYVITMPLSTGTHQGLRIEAMKHADLVDGQFSIGLKGGFGVTDMQVEWQGKPLKLIDPQTNLGGQSGADSLLDGNKYTVWSLRDPKHGPKSPVWLARFEKPIEVAEKGMLTIRMKHKARTGEAPIGRLHLSTTTYSEPTIKPELGLPKQVAAALRKPANKRSAADRKRLADQFRQVQQAPLKQQIATIRNEIKQIESKYLQTMVMQDRQEPRPTYRLERGLWNQPDKSENLQPGVFACLPDLPEDAPKNRLALARWLVRPDHPLTSRVTINRYWQHFFGVGLVKTSEDFGVQGDRPSHPEMLDWLSHQFVHSGWDVKQLHKLIVMSATYQQSSAATPELIEQDPYNRLLSRGPRFRLSAQALRDQALLISGLLVEKQGGPGVNPYQPAGVWADFSLGKIKYKQGKGEELYRRSLYTFWRRPVGPTMFFDNPGRQVCTVSPSLTNTPLHALTLLNDVTYVEAARVFAERLLRSDQPTARDRLAFAFRIATSRQATTQELDSLAASLQRLLEQIQSDPQAAAELVQAGESKPDAKLDVIELAAYTSLMNAILNLDEVLTKG